MLKMILELENQWIYYSDSPILATSWMRSFEADSEGWLACGNKSGKASITKTKVIDSEISEKNDDEDDYADDDADDENDEEKDINKHHNNDGFESDFERNINQSKKKNKKSRSFSTKYSRNNVNLRGVRVPIHIVEWNPVHQKLATCTTSGSILVYNRSRSQWICDLMNERAHAVEVFKWSHSSYQVMIGYADGLLIVGSVNGHRLWHRMMDMNSAVVTSTNTLSHSRNDSSTTSSPSSNYTDNSRSILPLYLPDQHPLPNNNSIGGTINAQNPNTQSYNVSGLDGGLNYNLSNNPFRTYQDDTVLVSRNYRRTTDISTYYQNDSYHRYRTNLENDLGTVDNDTRGHLRHEQQLLELIGLGDTTSTNGISELRSRNVEPIRLEDMPTITCGTWSPNDVMLTLATSTGSLLSFPFAWERLPLREVRQKERMLRINDPIVQIEWSCPAFRQVNITDFNTHPYTRRLQGLLYNRNETPNSFISSSTISTDSTSSTSKNVFDDSEEFCLSVSFASGHLFFMNNLDDTYPIRINTGLTRPTIAWNSTGTFLAVGGFIRSANLECKCHLKLYSRQGHLVYSLPIISMNKPISSLCWAHGDSRIFVSAGQFLHSIRVLNSFPSLTSKCCRLISNSLKHRIEFTKQLPLPIFLQNRVRAQFRNTLQGVLPLPHRLREFIILPQKIPCYCTFELSFAKNGAIKYTLFFEYLGASIPILIAVKTRSVKQEFLFYDPSLSQFPDLDSRFPFEKAEVDHLECSNLCYWQKKYRNYHRSMDSSNRSPSHINLLGRNKISLPNDICANLNDLNIGDNFFTQNVDKAGFKEVVNLMLDSNLPEHLVLAKMKGTLTNNRFELLGCQICLGAHLAKISYDERLKNRSGSGITVSLNEMNLESGQETVQYHQKLCKAHEQRFIQRNTTMTQSTFTHDLSTNSLLCPSPKSSNQKGSFSSSPNQIRATFSIDSPNSSCTSTPSHIRTLKSSSILNFPLIRSLPSTPKKIKNVYSPSHIFSSFNGKSSKYIDQSTLSVTPPSYKKHQITRHHIIIMESNRNTQGHEYRKIVFFYDNEEVLNLGRLETENRYFLEFTYPFSALQAFALALSYMGRLPK